MSRVAFVYRLEKRRGEFLSAITIGTQSMQKYKFTRPVFVFFQMARLRTSQLNWVAKYL